MISSRFISRLILTAVLLASVLIPSVAADGNKWVHQNGSFTKNEDGTWTEVVKGSPDVEHHFSESETTDEYIDLYDASRDCSVRLSPDKSYYKCPPAGHDEFVDLHDGCWAVHKVHFLFVIDTISATNRSPNGEGNLGGGPAANLKRFRSVIDQAVEANSELFEGRISISVLQDSDVSLAKIQEHYSSDSDAMSADGQVFYYCGHGAWDNSPEGIGHYLYTTGGDVARNEIRNLLMGTGARSIVMITDCCSSYFEFNPEPVQPPAKWSVFHRLFFENAGLVDLTAAREGEFGWSNSRDGGLYTQALCMNFCRKPEEIREDGREGIVTWDEVHANARKESNASFEEGKRLANEYLDDHPEEDRREFAIATSNPPDAYAFQIGGWPSRGAKRIAIRNSTGEPICVWIRFYDRNFTTEKWDWYPSDGTALRYEFNENGDFYPGYNGFYMEARAIQIWGNGVNSNVPFGSKEQYFENPNAYYAAPLKTQVYEITPGLVTPVQ